MELTDEACSFGVLILANSAQRLNAKLGALQLAYAEFLCLGLFLDARHWLGVAAASHCRRAERLACSEALCGRQPASGHRPDGCERVHFLPT